MKSTKCEKIFANHVPGNGHASRIYKELIQLKNKITKTLLKINNKMSRHESKEHIQINTLKDA